MVLVALALVAIIAMAALSIDVITLYLAREEAQRTADTAALAAARVISISGLTGDPSNSSLSWQAICGPPNYPATQAATSVAQQNAVGGTSIPTASVTVTYSVTSGGTTSSNTDCSQLPAAFGINPVVTVVVQRAGLPTFFSRIWGNAGNNVSATATAEAFNPSNSGNVGRNDHPGAAAMRKAVDGTKPGSAEPPAQSDGLYCDQAGGPWPLQPWSARLTDRSHARESR